MESDQTRKDQDRQRLRELLRAGAASKPIGIADQAYFESLRKRVRAAGDKAKSR